jgi:hypothetical protein
VLLGDAEPFIEDDALGDRAQALEADHDAVQLGDLQGRVRVGQPAVQYLWQVVGALPDPGRDLEYPRPVGRPQGPEI